jgi:L-ribulokinase
VKILGTSACDLLVHPVASGPPPQIPGLSGIVRDSIVPGCWGIEAGQAAVGDLFGWFVRELGAPAGLTHEILSAQAAALAPGASGLLALDWNNGNRSLLADPLLSGCWVGLTLRTRPHEIYRALIEATAFGARMIIDQVRRHGVEAGEIVACGGIAEKNPLLLEIYASVLGAPLKLSRARETCALGAAIFGAVAAGAERGGWATLAEAQASMTGTRPQIYTPRTEDARIYGELHELYGALHDAFGAPGREPSLPLHHVMKRLLEIQRRC